MVTDKERLERVIHELIELYEARYCMTYNRKFFMEIPGKEYWKVMELVEGGK